MEPDTPNTANALRKVIMVGYNQAQIIDIVGPMQILSAVKDLGHQGYDLTLTARDTGEIRTSSGIRLGVDKTFEDFSDGDLEDLDTLMIAGGDGTIPAMQDAALLGFLRRAARHADRLVSICSGVAILAQAGLIRGKRVATHWDICDEVADAFPDLTVDRDAIFVRDGRLWSSAGVTAGMDLALALIDEDWGHNIAVEIAKRHVLYMIRPGGQSQFSTVLEAQAQEQGRLGSLLKWITENPGGDLSVPSLAARAGMSERTLARVFATETDETPAQFVERVRIDAARQALQDSAATIDQIAYACGFGNTERMRRSFHRRLGVGPQAYRDRFRRRTTPKENDHEYRPGAV